MNLYFTQRAFRFIRPCYAWLINEKPFENPSIPVLMCTKRVVKTNVCVCAWEVRNPSIHPFCINQNLSGFWKNQSRLKKGYHIAIMHNCWAIGRVAMCVNEKALYTYRLIFEKTINLLHSNGWSALYSFLLCGCPRHDEALIWKMCSLSLVRLSCSSFDWLVMRWTSMVCGCSYNSVSAHVSQ